MRRCRLRLVTDRVVTSGSARGAALGSVNARGTLAETTSAPAERYAKIYAVVRAIPRGKVATYGQVAALAGIEAGHRIAARAMRICPMQMCPPSFRGSASWEKKTLGAPRSTSTTPTTQRCSARCSNPRTSYSTPAASYRCGGRGGSQECERVAESISDCRPYRRRQCHRCRPRRYARPCLRSLPFLDECRSRWCPPCSCRSFPRLGSTRPRFRRVDLDRRYARWRSSRWALPRCPGTCSALRRWTATCWARASAVWPCQASSRYQTGRWARLRRDRRYAGSPAASAPRRTPRAMNERTQSYVS